jgi:hypothetical protein
MNGMAAVAGLARSCASAVKPSMPGRLISMMTACGPREINRQLQCFLRRLSEVDGNDDVLKTAHGGLLRVRLDLQELSPALQRCGSPTVHVAARRADAFRVRQD